MSEKSAVAQSYIDGKTVARMQIEFGREFSDTYDIPELHMMGVGPMQSFLGFCVKQGYIEVKIDPNKRVEREKKWYEFW